MSDRPQLLMKKRAVLLASSTQFVAMGTDADGKQQQCARDEHTTV